jgi:signal transduction histidine kinase
MAHGDAVLLGPAAVVAMTPGAVEALRRAAPRHAGLLLFGDTLDEATLEHAEALALDDWFELRAAPNIIRRRILRSLRPSPEVSAEYRARRRVEQTLQHVERFARIGCYDYDARDETCVASEALREMLGLPADYPRHPTTFVERVHPEDQPRVAEASRLAQETLRAVEVEHRILRADTGEERHFISVIEAEADATGAVRTIRGLSQDVSARWQSAADRFAAQKLQAIGQLAGGVAHDFNNLLAVILLNASVLRGALTLEPEQAAEFDDILAAGQRGKALVRQLQAFSERAPAPDTPFDLAGLVLDLGALLRRLLRDDILLFVNAPAPAPVLGDPGELEQVVMNLVMNARDALPEGGRISIRVDAAVLDRETTGTRGGGTPGPLVRITVSDTGAGMAPEALPHLFEPFYTTKSLGDGPGLGLAAVHGIVRRHGGWVDMRSVAGQGTTFEVYLPRRAEA